MGNRLNDFMDDKANWFKENGVAPSQNHTCERYYRPDCDCNMCKIRKLLINQEGFISMTAIVPGLSESTPPLMVMEMVIPQHELMIKAVEKGIPIMASAVIERLTGHKVKGYYTAHAHSDDDGVHLTTEHTSRSQYAEYLKGKNITDKELIEAHQQWTEKKEIITNMFKAFKECAMETKDLVPLLKVINDFDPSPLITKMIDHELLLRKWKKLSWFSKMFVKRPKFN